MEHRLCLIYLPTKINVIFQSYARLPQGVCVCKYTYVYAHRWAIYHHTHMMFDGILPTIRDLGVDLRHPETL